MKYKELEAAIVSRGGTCRMNLFDAGYSIMVTVKDNRDRLVILRFSHEWGDESTPENRIEADLLGRGISLREDDPFIMHEGTYTQ